MEERLPEDRNEGPEEPKEGKAGEITRAGMQAVGGTIPFAGGLLSAIAGLWGEKEQQKWNNFFRHWGKMLEDEIREKQQTIVEIVARLNVHDEEIENRIKSDEYQSLIKKAFREWAGTESEKKRIYIRNILANAASASMTSDDVVRLFVDWIGKFSELHFEVIGAIYNSNGITRGEVWREIGKGDVTDESAEADLFKTLFHDLSTGHIIRQYRETTYDGRQIKQSTRGSRRNKQANPYMTSAFEDEKEYVLTALGEQFVHYAMTDLPTKITYQATENEPA